MKRAAEWLEDKIEESRRAAKSLTCHKCGSLILVGPSDDDHYWTAKVDPIPVDQWVECMERAHGRMSYDAIPYRKGTKLCSRGLENMRANPVWPILIDHRCLESK